ncbi:hypothetical protein [Fodinicola feengrottensis]|uniref:hypothetical protein n=1 Tax=Fodinicola feengrottensis TaxID=435914 RepID=UPI0024430411|nr:hypothetical protein [Fodinicola feengrottensis]
MPTADSPLGATLGTQPMTARPASAQNPPTRKAAVKRGRAGQPQPERQRRDRR